MCSTVCGDGAICLTDRFPPSHGLPFVERLLPYQSTEGFHWRVSSCCLRVRGQFTVLKWDFKKRRLYCTYPCLYVDLQWASYLLLVTWSLPLRRTFERRVYIVWSCFLWIFNWHFLPFSMQVNWDLQWCSIYWGGLCLTFPCLMNIPRCLWRCVMRELNLFTNIDVLIAQPFRSFSKCSLTWSDVFLHSSFRNPFMENDLLQNLQAVIF